MKGAARFALLFLRGSEALDYGSRLARLRWRRAFAPGWVVEASPTEPASGTFSRADHWLVVLDETALPLPSATVRQPEPGRVLLASAAFPSPSPHTLRELEEYGGTLPVSAVASASAPALYFRSADFPPAAGETVATCVARLARTPTPSERDPSFTVLELPDPYGHERPEVTRHLPARMRSLLDVGCGAGAASAAVKARLPGLAVTGIERNPGAADRARTLLDHVLCTDAAEGLARLANEGGRFDAFLFADVLEHLEDPIGALSVARRLSEPGARLVASVPNVGHLSLVRDLICGRFDPVPAGLADAGHLRWFTRRTIADALEEAGWQSISVAPLAGAAAPDADAFLSLVADEAGTDLESLSTYQWVAVADSAAGDPAEA